MRLAMSGEGSQWRSSHGAVQSGSRTESAHVTVAAQGAALRPVRIPPAPSSVVLVLHGGSADSFGTARWSGLAVLRLLPVARAVAGGVPGAAVYRLKLAIKGWNGTGAAALRDAGWALDQLAARHPGLPIVIVGHSMGARIAVRCAEAGRAVGVVALTPWLPAGDPVDHLDHVPLVVIQASRDRICPEPATRPWLARAAAAGADIRKTVLAHAGHAMLLRFPTFHRLAAAGVVDILSGSACAETGSRPGIRRPGPLRPTVGAGFTGPTNRSSVGAATRRNCCWIRTPGRSAAASPSAPRSTDTTSMIRSCRVCWTRRRPCRRA